jgi:two-component system, NtrC family, sensor kinase
VGVARVIVEDTGPGIPEDQIEQVFSPFVSTKKGRGTGLGLPVSQKILNEHGGRITIHSQPGHGSRFTLELPATLAHAGQETLVDSRPSEPAPSPPKLTSPPKPKGEGRRGKGERRNAAS